MRDSRSLAPTERLYTVLYLRTNAALMLTLPDAFRPTVVEDRSSQRHLLTKHVLVRLPVPRLLIDLVSAHEPIMANGSSVTTVISSDARDSRTSASLLSNSMSSMSASTRQSSAQISKTYKQASTLFLTRRLQEALSTLEPIIRPETLSDLQDADADSIEPAPIASASRTARIKVWSLYLTLLDAIIDLGAEEGRNTFGSQQWRELVAKVREGRVWEEVVQDGYGGIEGEVDAEVAINLATLLLSHAPSQSLNQQRLENHLSVLSSPNLDLSDHLQGDNTERRPSAHNGGTDTPRDLNSRIKLLELYTLHVLPRNEEWEYAREFIAISEVLDEERREAFSQTLQSLREEKNHSAQRETELQRQRDEQLERKRREAAREQAEREAEKKSPSSENGSLRHKRTGSETDYGIESHPSALSKAKTAKAQAKSKSAASGGTRSSPTPASPRAAKKTTASNVYRRTTNVMASFREFVMSLARSMQTNPMILVRTLLFLLGLLVSLSRSDVRDRIRRITGAGWGKLKGTVGMGVKVSYI